MSFAEGVADGPKSFGGYSHYHIDGSTKENTFDWMPKIGIRQPKPKWLYRVICHIVISYTFVHNHDYN